MLGLVLNISVDVILRISAFDTYSFMLDILTSLI